MRWSSSPLLRFVSLHAATYALARSPRSVVRHYLIRSPVTGAMTKMCPHKLKRITLDLSHDGTLATHEPWGKRYIGVDLDEI